MAKTNIGQFSTSAGSNTDVDSVNVDEGQLPGVLNNAIRALAALLAEWHSDLNGADLTASGTNTYTLSTTNTHFASPAALADIGGLIVKFTNANTSSTVTLAVDSQSATAIKKNGGQALSPGDIQAGATYLLVYDGTDFEIVGHTGPEYAKYREHNLAVNSHFQVSQENGNTGASTSAYFAADEWQKNHVLAGGAVTFGRVQSNPFTSYDNIEHALKCEIDTANSTPATTDLLIIQHRIEGVKLKALNLGSATSAGGKGLEIGFLCKALHTSGDRQYTLYVDNIANGGSYTRYTHQFTLTHNTDTWVTHSVPAPETGSWTEAEGSGGLRIVIVLGAGTDYDDLTNETWDTNAAQDYVATGHDNLWDDAAHEFYLGPMLVFPEGISTPADASTLHLWQRPFDRDLADCQRYVCPLGTDRAMMGQATGTTTADFIFRPFVPMAGTGSASLIESGTHAAIDASGTVRNGTALALQSQDANSYRLRLTGSSSLVAGNATQLLIGTSAFIEDRL